MKNIFFPDEYLDDITQIDIEKLAKNGIRCILSDVDNTLEPYEEEYPTEKTNRFFAHLKENNIEIAFISNNEPTRVDRFSKGTGYTYTANAKKPLTKGTKSLQKKLGYDKKEIVMLGDQIFTDILCGRLCGFYCILVKPIRDKKTLFFRFKRTLEKPILWLYGITKK